MSLAESRKMLSDVVEGVLGDMSDLDDPHVRPPTWTTIVGLDWPLVGIDEQQGGSGGTFADVVALVELAAGQAASLPLFETQIARAVIGSAAIEWEPETVIAPVVGGVHAVEGGIDGSLSFQGEVTGVPWASVADHLVIVSEDEVATLRADAAGVIIEPGQSVAGEPLDTVRLSDAVARVVGAAEDSARMRDRIALGRAAAMVGAASAAAALTADHVASREQFGRALSRFQLVRAGVASMAGELELARGALEVAVTAHLDDRDRELRTAVAIIAAARAATLVFRTSHQLHGAIGVTREHRLHRYTRRLLAWRDQAGSQRSWERWLGERAMRGGPDVVWSWFTTTGDGAG